MLLQLPSRYLVIEQGVNFLSPLFFTHIVSCVISLSVCELPFLRWITLHGSKEDALTNGHSRRIDGKQRVHLLTLVAAARRVAERHFEGKEADCAAMYWAGWHVSNVLNLASPLIRLAIVLERNPYVLVSTIGAYHALRARDPVLCERAYLEFLGLYDQMTRRPLYAVA